VILTSSHLIACRVFEFVVKKLSTLAWSVAREKKKGGGGALPVNHSFFECHLQRSCQHWHGRLPAKKKKKVKCHLQQMNVCLQALHCDTGKVMYCDRADSWLWSCDTGKVMYCVIERIHD
jgi:hypothetical protein